VGGSDQYKELLPRGARGAADPASIYRTVHDAVCPPVHCPEHEDRALSAGTADEVASEQEAQAEITSAVGSVLADWAAPGCEPTVCPACDACVESGERAGVGAAAAAAAAGAGAGAAGAGVAASATPAPTAACPACDACPRVPAGAASGAEVAAAGAASTSEVAAAGSQVAAVAGSQVNAAVAGSEVTAAATTCPTCDPCPATTCPTAAPEPPCPKTKPCPALSAVPKAATAIAIKDDDGERRALSDGAHRALSDVDDPPFDWTNIVDDALAKFPTITLVDVDSAEVSARVSVNSFRAQIVGGRLFIKDVRSLQFARDYAPSWKITLLEAMRRHRDLPDLDAVFNEGDYPVVQIPKDGAHQQRLYGRGSNGMKPPPMFSPTQSEMTYDIPFPDFSFSPPGRQGADRLNTHRYDHAHRTILAAGRAVPFADKLPLAAFTGNTQAMPRQKLVEVARSNPETVFVNQVFKKAPKGSLSCVKDGKADRGGFQVNECALSFEEMCRYRYLVNVGSNGYANKMKYLFLCGSVVITVREGMNNREFFERQLLPGVHYIAVREAREIPAVVRRLEADPAWAQGIASRGTRRMERFDMDAVTDYVAHVLRQYATRLQFAATRQEGTVEIGCEDDLYRHYDFNGGLQKFITEDNSTCLTPPEPGAALEPPGWGGTHKGEVEIPCDVANDLKEVPGACAGMRWPGWGPRCKRMECAEYMPEDA